MSDEDILDHLIGWHHVRMGFEPPPEILLIMFEALKAGKLVIICSGHKQK